MGTISDFKLVRVSSLSEARLWGTVKVTKGLLWRRTKEREIFSASGGSSWYYTDTGEYIHSDITDRILRISFAATGKTIKELQRELINKEKVK